LTSLVKLILLNRQKAQSQSLGKESLELFKKDKRINKNWAFMRAIKNS
jgi:hypothetical protein